MCVVTEVPFLDEMLTFCCGAEERAHRAAEQVRIAICYIRISQGRELTREW